MQMMSRYTFAILFVSVMAAQTPQETPRSALRNFFEAVRRGDYGRAAAYVRTSGAHARNANAAELARQLREVLDRKLTTDPALLSDNPGGTLDDGLDPAYELVGVVQARGGREVELLLERTTRAGGVQGWAFAPATIAMVPVLHEQLEGGAIERLMPAWLRRPAFMDAALWQWAVFAILLALAWTAAVLFTFLIKRALRPLVSRTRAAVDDELLASIASPVRLLIAVAVFRAGVEAVAPPLVLRIYTMRALATVAYLGIAWLVARIVDVVATQAQSRMTTRQRISFASVLPLARRTIKAAAIVLACLATLSAWGYNTGAILTGLGIGGLAVALAAQKTLENLFGGVSLTTDKPVLVGDFCKYGNSSGTVEDIGLRSTRIRTLDRTVVTVPNGQFSAMQIENFARRDKIWFHPVLHLRPDTTAEQVRQILSSVEDMLRTAPKVEDGSRARLIGVEAESIRIELFAYFLTNDFDEFLVIQQDLLVGVLTVIERAGAALAYKPTLIPQPGPAPT
jgi:MscS family membrane protein